MVSVYGFAKQLKKGGLTKEQEQEYIDIILSESQRLINMSTNILLLGKLENQEVISDKVKFSLDEEIRQSILMLCEEWSAKNIEIIPELEEIEYYGNPSKSKDPEYKSHKGIPDRYFLAVSLTDEFSSHCPSLPLN